MVYCCSADTSHRGCARLGCAITSLDIATLLHLGSLDFLRLLSFLGLLSILRETICSQNICSATVTQHHLLSKYCTR